MILALVLIVVVVGTSTALAFVLYGSGMNESITATAQRAASAAALRVNAHATLAREAPQILQDIGRSRFRIVIFDAQHHVLAQNRSAQSQTAGRRISQSIAEIIGLPRAHIPVAGGSIAINADLDRFGQVLLWYWSIMLPVGALAAFVAWLIGRRITARAIGPLREVTQSLECIGAGDFSPERLLAGQGELRELTSAYNAVVYRLTAAAAEQQRTETQMRQFIADAGHELRTPLTIIMGYLDILRHGVVSDSEGTQRAYATMLQESRRMRTLIEKLIFLARLDRPVSAERAAPLDVSALVSRAAASLAPLAGERIQVQGGNDAAIAVAEETEVYEAIKNILDNALKYADGSPVVARIEQDGANVRVAVSDNGPGMDAQDVAHAFDRFYRGSTKGETEGSGLGLAIAKSAAERAGGSIEIESTPGRGTCVILALPGIKSAAPSPQFRRL